MDAIKKAILRLIIYARVSSDDQAEKGYSLPTQLVACRTYAERLGFTVVAEFTEDCSGAKPIGDRPEGQKVVTMLARHEADAILVYQVDRLSRDIVDLLARVQMWTRAGVQVHTCDMGRIENELDIVLIVRGWQGSDERKKILERTTRGRNGKAQAGKVVGSNRAPYGYRFIRDHNNKVVGLEIYEEEAGTVRLIFRWYLHGDENDEPLGMKEIARRLQQMGIPTPGAEAYANRGARGIWNHGIVGTIIENETYAGVWHYGNRKGVPRKRTPVDEHLTVSVPAIVDHEKWQAAQSRRKYNKLMSRRNAKHEYLLRGLIKCGCERSMYGRCASDHDSRCYICVGRSYVKSDCHEPRVPADRIEMQIWEGLKGFFHDLKKLERELRIAQQQELDAQEPKRDELEAVEANIEHADRDADEIAMTMRLAKGRVKESFQQQQDEVNARYEALTKRRAELQAELGARRLTDEVVTNIMTYARDVKEGIENATPELKRHWLEALLVTVTVKNSHYTARCVLGEWEGEIIRGRWGMKHAIENDTFDDTSHRRCRRSSVRR